MKQVISIALGLATCLSQCQPIAWTQQIPSALVAGVQDVEFSPDGSRTYVLTSTLGSNRYGLNCLDSFGNLVWAKSFTPGPVDVLPQVLVTSNDAIYVTGRAYEHSLRKFISRIDLNGNELWFTVNPVTDNELRSYPGSKSVLIGTSLFVPMNTNNPTGTYIEELDVATGNRLNFVRLWGLDGNFLSGNLSKTLHDEIVVAEMFNHPNGDQYNACGIHWLTKGLVTRGTMSARLAGSGIDPHTHTFASALDDADSVSASSMSSYQSQGFPWDFSFMKVPASFDIERFRVTPRFYGQIGRIETPNSLIVDWDGNSVMGAQVQTSETGYDMGLVCYDSKVNLRWTHSFDEDGFESGARNSNAIATGNGYTYISFTTHRSLTNFVTTKSIDNTTGSILWSDQSEVDTTFETSAIDADSQGNTVSAWVGKTALGAPVLTVRRYQATVRPKPSELYGWGSNIAGNLGVGIGGISPVVSTATLVPGHRGLEAIDGGQNGAGAAVADHIKFWGSNDRGQFGRFDFTGSSLPVGGLGDFGDKKLAIGRNHGIGLGEAGIPRTFGDNTFGQRGGPIGGPPETTRWINIPALDVGTGYDTTFVISNARWVYSCGNNVAGQLGDVTTGTTRDSFGVVRRSAQQVLTSVVSADGGQNHSLFLDLAGKVWACGSNTLGQLGSPSFGTVSRYAVSVPNLSGISAIACAEYSSYAVKSDGTLWAWGSNNRGQLGDGTTTRRLTPVQVPVPGTVIKVAAGREHALALTSDGFVYAWGANSYGQLGNGSVFDARIPTKVRGITGATIIGAGWYQSYALGQRLQLRGVKPAGESRNEP
ncbi:MAG: hypothetical protein K8R88_06905 [Armatimonadetes bacterium]|nr:hypothetical protein [Armatimonadota bacterium]